MVQPQVQGNCYLKTKTGAFKQHFFSVKGDNDIEFRKKRNFKLKLTVCLSTCHLRLIKFSSSHTLKGRFHPLQIDVSESHSRLLYFTSEAAQNEAMRGMLRLQGFKNQFDQYMVLKRLGSGAYS